LRSADCFMTRGFRNLTRGSKDSISIKFGHQVHNLPCIEQHASEFSHRLVAVDLVHI